MDIGYIDWFDKNKGYGIITSSDNQEVFFHISDWIDDKEFLYYSKTPIIYNTII